MSDDPMVEKYIFNLERERDTLRARVSELEAENKRKIEQLATQVSHVMDLEAENEHLRHGCCEKMEHEPCDYSIVQAEAAGMREALQRIADGIDYYNCCEKAQEVLATTTAGQSFLDRLRRAEAVVEAAKEWKIKRRSRMLDGYNAYEHAANRLEVVLTAYDHKPQQNVLDMGGPLPDMPAPYHKGQRREKP